MSCCLKLIGFRSGEEYCGFALLLWCFANHTKPPELSLLCLWTVTDVTLISHSCASKIRIKMSLSLVIFLCLDVCKDVLYNMLGRGSLLGRFLIALYSLPLHMTKDRF